MQRLVGPDTPVQWGDVWIGASARRAAGTGQTLNQVRRPVSPIRHIEVEADYPEFVRRSQATGFINEAAIHVRPTLRAILSIEADRVKRTTPSARS